MGENGWEHKLVEVTSSDLGSVMQRLRQMRRLALITPH